MGVEGAGHEGGQELLEGGQTGVGVGEDEVKVVREDAVGVDPDAVALGREGKDVGQDLVDHRAGAEEEVAEQAAARDEVGATREDLPWRGHGRSLGSERARSGPRKHLGTASPTGRAADHGP
jgi:hypothetical protein